MLSERFRVILETRPPIPGGYGQFCNLAWENRAALLAAVEGMEALGRARRAIPEQSHCDDPLREFWAAIQGKGGVWEAEDKFRSATAGRGEGE